jgi:hypothetical protein
MDSLRYSDEDKVRDNRSHLLTSLEWAFRFVALLTFLYSIYLLMITGQLFVVLLGNVSSVTTGCVGAIILLSEYCFSRYQQMGATNAMVFSVLLAASFVWSYEIIYYLSFPQSLDFSATNISQLGDSLRTIAVSGIQLLPIILLRKKLTFGKMSAVLLALFSTMWIFWILYGFPQYYLPNYLGGTMYPKILVASDPFHVSLFFDFGSKAVLGVFFVSLLKFPYRDAMRAFARRISSIA